MDQSNKKILGTSLIHDIFEKVVFLMHPTARQIITAHLDPVGGHISIPSLGVADGTLVNAHAECAPLFNLIDGTSNIGFRVSD